MQQFLDLLGLLRVRHASSLNFIPKVQEAPKYSKCALGKGINIEMQLPEELQNHLVLPPTQSRKPPHSIPGRRTSV
jgi:hypothetical protein